MNTKNESTFKDLLLLYAQELSQESRQEINQKIWKRYGEKKALLVIDMSGFTRISKQYGAVHYLSMILRMQLTAEPIIKSFNGHLLKFEADNCFALFDNPADAIQTATTLNFALDAENIITPNELDIQISCGVDYGNILLVDDDLFGNPVNHASKLGEDIASSGEILVTKEAMESVKDEIKKKSTPVSHIVSNIKIDAFKIHYR